MRAHSVREILIDRVNQYVDYMLHISVADQSLEVLAGLLNDSNVNTVKVVVQCFPTVYALMFRSL